jgi:hypothetical protein
VNTDLLNLKKDHEVEIKEQRYRMENLQHELDLAKNELRDLREANKGLDTTKFS